MPAHHLQDRSGLQRDGTLTPLGDAFARYGRIFKTRHLLTYIDDPDYRRDIKGIRNLQEGRHSLAKHVCHGKQGEIHRRYQQGTEEQLGALGLVLNCVTLWNTAYMDATLTQLRTTGYPSWTTTSRGCHRSLRKHINVHRTYTFTLPELAGGCGHSATLTPPTKTTDGRGCQFPAARSEKESCRILPPSAVSSTLVSWMYDVVRERCLPGWDRAGAHIGRARR